MNCVVRRIASNEKSIVECSICGRINDLVDAAEYSKVLKRILSKHVADTMISLKSVESIGQRYVIYKYEAIGHGECRIIVDKENDNTIIHSVCLVNDSLEEYGREIERKLERAPMGLVNKLPRGQKLIPKPVVYAVNGFPNIRLSERQLIVEGLVENRLELSYENLLGLPKTSVEAMFHCVTGWSIEKQVWEGVELRRLAEMAKVKRGARWVLVEGLDGYTTIIPLEDFLYPQSLLVLGVNGKPLSPEHGFPARIFIPHLYGWKHAKWVKRIVFLEKYVNGYWEALGYHERGNVLLEERFKGV